MELHNLNTDAAVPSLNCDNAYRQPIVIPDVEETAKWDALASDFCARMDSAGEQEITLIKNGVRFTYRMGKVNLTPFG